MAAGSGLFSSGFFREFADANLLGSKIRLPFFRCFDYLHLALSAIE